MNDIEKVDKLKTLLGGIIIAATGDPLLKVCHGLICVTGGNPPDLGLDSSNYSAPGDTPISVFARQ